MGKAMAAVNMGGYMFLKILKTSVIFILLFGMTACTDTALKTKTEPGKESFEVLLNYSSLANNLKYDEAKTLLEKNYEVIKDNDIAMHTYGFTEYYIYENYNEAEELFKRAIKLNPNNADHYTGLGYCYEAEGNYKQAIKYFNKAIKKIDSYENVPLNPQLSICYKDIGRCYIKLNDKNKAIQALKKSSENNPYSIDTNQMLHLLYVENEEYNKAYNIWKNDNYIDVSGNCSYESILQLNKLYNNEITNYSGHLKMANMYDSLRLYDEAAIEYKKALREDKANEINPQRLEKINTYILFRDKLQVLMEEYYRDRCTDGEIAESEFYNIIKPAYEIIEKIYPEVDINQRNSSLWFDRLNNEIEKDFNIKIQSIKANRSRLGLHFGKILDNSTINYSLWGKDINLNLITLKNMYSNGVDDWRSMGNGGVGGWSLSTSEIVRVIKNNEIDNVLKLSSIYNEEAKKDFYESQALDIVLEEVARKPFELYFTPDTLKELLEKQIKIEIDRAKLQGISDNELQQFIFDRYDKDFTIKTNIYIHESQHSIDSKYGIPLSWFGENEYRAKMSQLAYGDMPFMSLSQFYGTTIGEDVHDTHSMANTRVFSDIISHINDNSNKYPEIDTNKNILSQLINLSEEDLKDISIKIFEKNYPMEKYK